MKNLQKGFAQIGTIIISVAVTALVGVAVYTVMNNKSEEKKESSTTATETEKTATDATTVTEEKKTTPTPSVDTTGWTLIAPKGASNTFSVKVPKGLLPNGTCMTKEVLLGIVFNSDSYDYDCKNVSEALQLAAIVFGENDKSIVPQFGTAQSTSKVTLADGKTEAIKSVVAATAKGDGGGSYNARYVFYEAVSISNGKVYYAVYKTGIGYSDEDKFLKDFELAVMNGWTIP